MSTKLTPEVIVKAAGQVGISKDQQQALLEMLADMVATESDEEKLPAIKKQFVFILADATGRFTKEFFESSGIGALTGWVVQIPESESPHTAPKRIKDAADVFNCTKKGRLLPVQTVGEACESIPARFFKEQAIWLKTKCAIYAILTANELPDTPSILGSDRGSAKFAAVALGADVETADGRKITRG